MNCYLYRLRCKGKKNNLYRKRFIYFFLKEIIIDYFSPLVKKLKKVSFFLYFQI